MIESFFDQDAENAHAAFQRWRGYHYEDGYFLNYKSPNSVMLHRSACPHLSDTDWARFEHGYGSLTCNKKLCSTDYRKLERWATGNAAVGLERCRDCERL